MKWYYAANGEQLGPVEETTWTELIANGTVRPDTLVWHEGMPDWIPFSRVAVAGGANANVCAECGKTFAPDELIPLAGRNVCAGCKPFALQKLKEGITIPGQIEYAGFWIRVGAKLIDGIILGVINMIVTFGVGAVGSQLSGNASHAILLLLQVLIQFGFGASYTAWFLSRQGATPGKLALGLRVIRPDSGPISFWRGVGRYFAEMLSSFILLIGYIMVAFDDEKRALHDRICDTRVIRK